MDGLQNPLKNIRKPSGSGERDRRLKPSEYEKLAASSPRAPTCGHGHCLISRLGQLRAKECCLFCAGNGGDLEACVIYIPLAY